MDEALGVNIQELLDALTRNGVPLPYEIGTFVALEACEAVLDRPALLNQTNVWLRDDGEVSVTASGVAGEADAARSVVTLLGGLLVKSAPGVPPMLLSLVEMGTGDGRWELSPLRDAIEATLVPLNRDATKRVLARIVREAGGRGRSMREPEADERAVSSKLDAMLGVDSEQAERFRSPPPTRVADSLRPGAPSEHADQLAREDAADGNVEASGTLPGGSPVLDARERDVERIRETSGPRATLIWAMLLFVLLAFGIAWWVAQPASDAPVEDEALGAAPANASAVPTRAASLSSEPGGAQVLLRVGRGGEPIDGFAIGVAHELVVLRKGVQRAERVLVPADAEWDANGHRMVALPARTTPAPRELVPSMGPDLGPTRLTRAPTGGAGAVGTITVDAPADAQVFKLVGFTPDARVDGLPVDRPAELLLYRQGYRLERLTLTPESLAEGPLAEPVRAEVALARWDSG